MLRHSPATVMNSVAFSVTNTGMGSVTNGDALSTWILRWKATIILARPASLWGMIDGRWTLRWLRGATPAFGKKSHEALQRHLPNAGMANEGV